ncbi:M3 family metallopeptidase [Oharaeibacter diazotrophicus]|uniref:Peptidyl-dipeptidase Dcp n=1 Tax=Oharaeibacter diazotrophicus TaxID=1920512 RepID=A0A4R6R5P3_9HYPH|nr:M3 family metallopeptidase [Oharaeibacter diazotrophicus]TDP80925.1 peptidyl-dipeptidase Dcp [Oharaeibacter diazotrophicus]BBE73820.1 peptidyl-dipeptidase dcp [Pleomorphomonas sp. SM30]GLS74696.1 peptidyl-dipeptidase Dcp [Oharaeibacter diazotrophicus]
MPSTTPLTDWTGPLGLPDFAAIADDAFAPAFDAALAAHETEIAAIGADPAAPTFANTVEALELAGRDLQRVSSVFWLRAGAETNDAIRALEREIAPRLSRHWSKVGTDPALFSRVDALWQGRDGLGLTVEQARVLERHWKGFVHSGARLAKPEQERLSAIRERLAGLGARFGQNVLADEVAWVLLVDAGDLDGLPADLVDAMAAEARNRGADGRYAVTLSRSIVEPFLTFSERRDLRETVFRAFVGRGETGGDTDNRAVVAEILALRAEAAGLLGYADHAAYALDDTMAKTAGAVGDLLGAVWDKARGRALAEETALAALVAEEGRNHPVMPWDWRHYAEKLRRRTFDFSEAEVKAHLPLERMIEAAFEVARRLFGLVAVPRPDVVAWHPDVRAYEMRAADGSLKAVFLGDYFARPSKHSGAWMSSLQDQHRLAGGQVPIVYNVCNFAKPGEGRPALLSIDDARTLFHEFGHALHGMLSDVTYPSVSGTSVPRDFVELPSQLYEHWLTVPAVLETFARHHDSGAAMPRVLIDKLAAARTFNAGFATVEFTASALVDMAFHTGAPAADPLAVEAEVLERIGMPAAIAMRHRTPHFGHVFSGGYAAGYYSYMWSEVLDADAFAAFTEAGDPFDPATAEKLARHVYAAGGAVDPAETYVAFRGRMPNPEAMMRKKGLIAA